LNDSIILVLLTTSTFFAAFFFPWCTTIHSSYAFIVWEKNWSFLAWNKHYLNIGRQNREKDGRAIRYNSIKKEEKLSLNRILQFSLSLFLFLKYLLDQKNEFYSLTFFVITIIAWIGISICWAWFVFVVLLLRFLASIDCSRCQTHRQQNKQISDEYPVKMHHDGYSIFNNDKSSTKTYVYL